MFFLTSPPATHSVSDKPSTNSSPSVVSSLTASPGNLLEMHVSGPTSDLQNWKPSGHGKLFNKPPVMLLHTLV